MTRKDTILIAVVINAGLLSILFATAVIYDTDEDIHKAEILTNLPAIPSPKIETPPPLIATLTGDEVDNVLKYYQQPAPQVIEIESSSELPPEPVAVQSNIVEEEEVNTTTLPSLETPIEIRVKKGDVLEKIARANGTTTADLKRFNHLQSERLAIGQVLKIPPKPKETFNTIKSSKKQDIHADDPKEAVYYVVKTGDNPWKIAKQFHVKFDDILKLNDLDEEKARNMKIGDRIRVK